MSAREVTLVGGSPWGFRMHGGHDLHQPLRISRVNPGSKAAQQGVREGDLISSINDRKTRDLTNGEAHALLRNAGDHLKLGLNQETVGSPKRRIYKSSLQENTSIERLKKTTTKTTTTSSTQIVSADVNKINGTDDTRIERDTFAGLNGGPKSSSSATERSNTDGETRSVWSPGSEPPPPPRQPSPERGKNTEKDAGIPPVWTPSSAGTSPVAERKEFRPVAFESPVLSRKKFSSEKISCEAPPPWKNEDIKRDASQSVTHNITTRIVNSHSAPSQGLNTLAGAPRLPRAQNPTITLLQKAREGQLPKGAAYLEDSEPSVSRVKSYTSPRVEPVEIIHTVMREYDSEPETVRQDRRKKVTILSPRKIEGIGPTTKDGMPVALRSEVKDNNQARWYKKMYDSLHRTDKDGQSMFVTTLIE